MPLMTSLQPRTASTAAYYAMPPAITDADGSQHWITRAANFVVVTTKTAPGAELRRDRTHQTDEYMVLLTEGLGARFDAGGETLDSPGDSLVIVPPGDSAISVAEGGWVYRVFSKLAADLIGQAQNAGDYPDGAPEVAPLETWPEPVGGYRLRHYALAEHVRPDTTMRLFRSQTLMLNVFLPNQAPRDIRKMTPHAHADFEQGSLAVAGTYIHHLRYPWTPDMNAWREDLHVTLAAPSLQIMPAGVVHTSQSVGVSGMRLVDVFAPPRDDFSLKPGLVCNAAEYPLPERLRGQPAPTSAA